MNLLDLIIIYLACGSPFGVYQITKRQPARSGADWLKITLSFLCWPAFAANLLAGRFLRPDERAEADRRNRIEDIRLDIEKSAFSGESISLLFEFREGFYRFTGLSEAIRVPTLQSTHELYEVTGHPNKTLASGCLTRRNGKRLAFHQAGARSEFVDLLFQLSNNASNHDLIDLASELADELQEPEMKACLTSKLTQQPTPTTAPANDVAKPELRSLAHTTSV